MALTKKGRYWHYDFIYRGKRYQGSTDQANKNKAKLVEAKVRSDAALEHFGIAPPKQTPLFKDFLEGRFLEYVRKHAKKPRTATYYAVHVARLMKYPPFASLRLNQIDEEVIAAYSPKGAIATINGDFRTLRRALNLATEWRMIRKVKVRTLPGENVRKFVVSGELEALYLSIADYPLKQAAILIMDLGLRPEEVVSLKKADVTNGSVTVREGKSSNAARSLPLTERASCQVKELSALWPESEWLFPGRKGYLRRTSLDNLHTKLRNRHDLPKEFVLYSFRHTFATRLAESGASPFELKAALGHGDIRVTQRYVHSSDDHLRVAMKRKEALDKMMRGEVAETESLQKPR